ncbi:MAG: tail fiber domain-containing protein, partial [Clostridia bacterium]
STIRQDATQISSTVSNLSGSISAIQQGVDRIDATVSGANGLAAQVSVLSDRVAIKLAEVVGGNNVEARFSTDPLGTGRVGMSILVNNRITGGIYSGNSATGTNELAVISTGSLRLSTDDTSGLYIGSRLIQANGDFCPIGQENAGAPYSLGTRSPKLELRWKNVNITGSVDTSSDLRLKTDVAPLDMAELLGHLRPIRYRMIADGENGKVRWGFGAQHVREALGALGVQDVEFLDQENPEHLALCYQELIAVLVEGYQKLSARVAQLEKTLAKGGA